MTNPTITAQLTNAVQHNQRNSQDYIWQQEMENLATMRPLPDLRQKESAKEVHFMQHDMTKQLKSDLKNDKSLNGEKGLTGFIDRFLAKQYTDPKTHNKFLHFMQDFDKFTSLICSAVLRLDTRIAVRLHPNQAKAIMRNYNAAQDELDKAFTGGGQKSGAITRSLEPDLKDAVTNNYQNGRLADLQNDIFDTDQSIQHYPLPTSEQFTQEVNVATPAKRLVLDNKNKCVLPSIDTESVDPELARNNQKQMSLQNNPTF